MRKTVSNPHGPHGPVKALFGADNILLWLSLSTDLDEILGEGLISTGENLSAGSVLQIHFKHFGTDAATVPRIVNTVCIFERLVEIADTEVRVFE